MRDTLLYSATLYVISCGECEIPFAIPQSMHRLRKQDGREFWCPNGHKIAYSAGENERLKRELERARTRLDWAETARKAARDQAESAQRSANAYKGHLTRTRKRIAAGVCPSCNRSFANVAAHMETRHPDYAETEPANG